MLLRRWLGQPPPLPVTPPTQRADQISRYAIPAGDLADIDGWASDDHATAFAAFLESCRAVNVGQTAGRGGGCDCGRAQAGLRTRGLPPSRSKKTARANSSKTISARCASAGLAIPTGFSPAITSRSWKARGCRPANSPAPLYRRPPNLVISGRRKLGDAFPSKGVKVGRRVGRRKIAPYYDRGEIEDGALDGWHLEICYLRSQLDVLFAQIQGSARIRLEDGTILRVNYDSHNGWPYTRGRPRARRAQDSAPRTK